MAYDTDSEYEDPEYPWKPHVGGRYYGSKNFRYGAQPDIFGQEFGDRASKLLVYVPQQFNLTLGGFLGVAAVATPIGLIQSNFVNTIAGASGTIACVLNGITPGSLVTVRVSYDYSGPTTTTSIKDDLNVAGALGKSVNASGITQRVEIYYFASHGGGNRTFTWTGNNALAQFRSLVVAEWSGVLAVSPLDGVASVDSGAGSPSTTPSTGNVAPTPSVDGCLVYGLITAANVPASAAPFSDLHQDVAGFNDDEYYIQPVAAAIAATWTQASGNYGCAAVVFKPAAPASLGQPLSGALSSAKNLGGLSQVLSGGIGPIGDLTKLTSRIFDGSFTPSGAITRLISRTLAGAIGPSGIVSRLVNRTLAGGFTPAGALARARQYLRTLTGGFTPSGDVTKRTSRTLVGAVPSSGVVTKRTNRTVTGAVPSSGTVAKQTSRALAGSIGPTGTLQKLTSRLLAGAVTFAGVVTKTTVFLRTLAGGLTFSGTLTKQTNKTLAGAVGSSGTLTKRVTKTMAGVLGPSGVVAKFLTKALSGSVAPSGTLAAIKTFLKTLTGAFAPSGTVQRKTFRTTQGATIPSGAVTKRTFRTLSGQIGLSGQITRIRNKLLSGFIVPTGVATWQTIGHDFLVLMAGTEGARYIIGALSTVRYWLENKSESRYGPTHTGEASDEIDSNSSSKDDL